MYTEVIFIETTLRFFYQLASVVGCGCEFYVGTLHCNYIDYEFWPYLNFLLEQQIKLVLISNLRFYLVSCSCIAFHPADPSIFYLTISLL